MAKRSWLTPLSFFITLMVSSCHFEVSKLADHTTGSARLQMAGVGDVDFSLYKLGNRNGGSYNDHYMDKVQPIIAKRCVVCHSCSNGPCSLNMTSYKALERGVNKDDPYFLYRLVPGIDTRVANNFSMDEWRRRNFFSILPGAEPTVAPKDSILYKNLWRGQQNLASNPAFSELEIRRMTAAHEKSKYECPINQREYANFEKKYPVGGMPCGMAALDPAEAKILLDWVAGGAQGPSQAAQLIAENPQTTTASLQDADGLVEAWEQFLNPEELRGQLVARYIFEHTYMANIQLEENPGEFYRIVRTHEPPGEKIHQISTETPQDDPGPGRIYYRLQKVDRVIEAKTHIPWRLKLADIDLLKRLFFADEWTIERLPDYQDKNPFAIFESIPTRARSGFMLQNAWLMVQSISRGPVCFKQEHTYGVDQYFFVVFLAPDADPSVVDPKLGLSAWSQFYSKQSWRTALPFDLSFREGQFRQAFEIKLRQLRPHGLNLNDVWDGGDQKNPNALIAVNRHQYTVDAAQARMRPLTGRPNSVLLLSYASFERRYYNEVVQFKYWGTLAHKFATWDWAVYLRTESEDLFVSLLPDQAVRDALRQKLTGPLGRVAYWLFKDYARGRPADTQKQYTEETLLKDLLVRLGPEVVGSTDTLNNWPDDDMAKTILPEIQNQSEWEMGLRTLTGKAKPFTQFVPNIVFVRLGGETLYSLTVNRGYIPDKIISGKAELKARRRQSDILLATRGLSGVAPELFFDLSYAQASGFLKQFSAVRTLDEWRAFANQFKIPRNSPQFWPFVDWLHDWQALRNPVDAAILELKLYDKGDLPF